MGGDLPRSSVDQGRAVLGSAGGQQLLTGLHQQRQTGRRLPDGADESFPPRRALAAGSGERASPEQPTAVTGVGRRAGSSVRLLQVTRAWARIAIIT